MKSLVVVEPYRNGAIVLHLDLSHPDALDFINSWIVRTSVG